jgi:hypothetical protein
MNKSDHAKEVEVWLERQTWTFVEAAYLLAGLIPRGYDPLDPVEDETGLAPLIGPDDLYGQIGAAQAWYRDLKDAAQLKRIEVLSSRTLRLADTRVEPLVCISWAKTRPRPLPEYFQALTMAGRDTTESLGQSERASLLKLVITMAIDGYKYEPTSRKSPLASELTDAAQKLGLTLTDDTARKWLKQASELLSTDVVSRISARKK